MAINIREINNIIKRARKLPSHLQIIVTVLPSIILIGLFIFLIYSPKNKEIEALVGRIAKLDIEIASSEAKLKRLDSLIAENKLLKEKLEKLKEQLPEEKEVSGLLKQISRLGLQSGLEIVLWQPKSKQTNPEGLYVEIPVSVEVLTGYHMLGEFFSHISRLKRLVNISDIDMRVQSTKTSGGRFIIAKFIARTFASKDDSVLQ